MGLGARCGCCQWGAHSHPTGLSKEAAAGGASSIYSPSFTASGAAFLAVFSQCFFLAVPWGLVMHLIPSAGDSGGQGLFGTFGSPAFFFSTLQVLEIFVVWCIRVHRYQQTGFWILFALGIVAGAGTSASLTCVCKYMGCAAPLAKSEQEAGVQL